MDLLLSSIDIIARWDVIAALFIGSIGGVLVGALPGVGAAVAIAIMLPATFMLEPIVGLTALLGVYGSSMFGGAIPAILVNTPGTPVNALTTYDGFPMTQRGEARRALGLAYSASFFGGIFAILCLMIFAPVLAKVAPMFGAREIFLAALLGIVLVVVTHRGQVLAAGMLACFGIFLQTIGIEGSAYTQRFTFGQSWLQNGIDLIVVVLGLFAISQALVLFLDEDKNFPMPHVGKKGFFHTLLELRHFKRVATVGSGFGVICGMIPGVGEFMSQFMSYSYAQRTSKTPETFGKGNPEGLIASEAANNSVPPAAMVPLLALGIPGEELTAMMLSVFYVHNVIPGPALFANQMDFILALYICLILLNVIVVAFLFLATDTLMKVMLIPNRFLGMMIMTFSLIGVYSLRNSLTDIFVAAGFGVFGMILKRLDWPTSPVILGIVLGGLMEDKLRTAMARVRSPLEFIERPIAMVLFAMIVAAVGIHFYTLWRDTRTSKEEGK
ncbi:tripartite tricarboxylate transporter permease [Donghicola tyrosinivorans]|uniref:Putative tricarboxylic transport membrane protein n=1 Tax=Donghicola tyrosinivorans TaxID=1652492 RepID=A0A2T0WDK7_9RHOB|nr:tripartite tricarboxylate transporter permease [Donghicola tyrosinivorans]PRY84793.1 putative tricarboxylic transport membrane protein [Donghicola tyrosinivorans]